MRLSQKENLMNKKYSPSGVMLYAKTPGITSFSSLWSIKHALGTDKVGHTGTLDSFAEGLLVVLSGSLTHLVPHITGFTKTYRAVVCFGRGTDTLDPGGAVTATGRAPSKEEIETVLPSFTGALLQTPPVYSAVHVGGKRASDMARTGKAVTMESRQVFVYSNTMLDYRAASDSDPCSYAILEIVCSKGTYIRALARDIAQACGTCAHLSALRRTSVGPFKLEDAACVSMLGEFTIDSGIKNDMRFQKERDRLSEKIAADKKKNRVTDPQEVVDDIRSHFRMFTPELASLCGFRCDTLKEEFLRSYLNGRPLSSRMFTKDQGPEKDYIFYNPDEISVFYPDRSFAGIIKINEDYRLSYGFVVPPEKEKKISVFSWDDVSGRAFPVEWLAKGTSVSVGSFDGFHSGHAKLVDGVLAGSGLVSGILMFRKSFRSFDSDYQGDVSTLRQRIDYCAQKGVDFVVVIDFSDEFSRMEGSVFVRKLLSLLNMKRLVEGKDFRCGYKGSLDMESLRKMSVESGFELVCVDNVDFNGERVSSSRIRDSVKKACFADVQKMLLRPFSYDCSGFDWKISKKKSSSDFSWFETESSSEQVLPSDGDYNVVAVLSDGSSEKDPSGLNTLHTVCSVSGGRISLLLPAAGTSERVRTVNFIPAV